ncbi:MAG: septum formation initiator family protein [Firmicutes bacterium]|nr:septum formation initiator family protein [Bacillota bacterium]
MQEKAKIFRIITVAAIVFIVFLAAAMIMNFVKIAKAEAQSKWLKEELAAKLAQYESNEGEIDYKQSEEYVTRYAREELNMKGKGETAFTS